MTMVIKKVLKTNKIIVGTDCTNLARPECRNEMKITAEYSENLRIILI